MKRVTAVFVLYAYTAVVLHGCGLGPEESPAVEVGRRIDALYTPPTTVPADTFLPTDKMSNGYAADRVSGSGRVGYDGAAGYTVPLWVPPGRAGLQPDLSLTYSNRRGDGLFGVGFNLTGLHQITRCPKNLAQNGITAPVSYKNRTNIPYVDDVYCLDGEQLLLSSGAYGAAGSQYRTEQDSFVKIVAGSSDSMGPLSFTTYSKDGLIRTFGAVLQATAQVGVSGGGTLRTVRVKWALSKIEDRYGNYLTFTYDTSAQNEQTIAFIAYTGSTPNALAPSHGVRFTYSTRANGRSGYTAGVFSQQTRLVSKIEMGEGTAASFTVLRSYAISYQTSTGTGRPRIASISECDRAAVCKPPLTFTWSDSTPFQYKGGGTPIVLQNKTPLVTTGDIDGDGRDDVLGADTGSGGAWFTLSKGTSWGMMTRGPLWSPRTPSCLAAAGPELIDFDGDGKAELVGGECAPCAWDSSKTCFRPSVLWDLATSTSTASSEVFLTGQSDTETVPVSQAIAGDLEGKGQPGIVLRYPTWIGTSSYLRRSGRSFGSPITIPLDLTSPGAGRFVDQNGLGTFSLTGIDPNYRGTGWFRAARILNGSVVYDSDIQGFDQLIFADVNGDGLQDAVTVQVNSADNRVDASVSLNLGNGGFAAYQIWGDALTFWQGCVGGSARVHVEDMDGDGLQDLILSNTCKYPTLPYDAPVYVLRSTGSAFVPKPLISTSNVPLRPLLNNKQVNDQLRTLDYNGDGQPDLLTIGDNGTSSFVTAWQKNGEKPDLLKQITDGAGGQEVFVYSSLVDTNVYTRGGAPAYPLAAVTRGLSVVLQHKMTDPSGGLHAFQYRYADGKQDVSGRGFVGFASVTVTDLATNETTVTTFNNSGGAGDPKYFLARLPATETTTTYFANPCSGCAYRVTSKAFAYTIATGSGTGAQFPYLSSLSTTVTETRSSVATLLRKTDHTFAMDQYGNLTSEVITDWGLPVLGTGSAKSTTTNTVSYDNDATSWLIGKARRVMTTSTTQSGATVSRVREFDWVSGTGALLRTRIEPDHKLDTVSATSNDLYKEVTLSLDSFGLVKTISEVGSGQTRTWNFQWDSTVHATPVVVTDALNHSRHLLFDPATSLPVIWDDLNNLRTRHQYDGFGRPRVTTRPDGSSTSYSYTGNASTRTVSVKSSSSNLPRTAVTNAAGAVIQETWPSFDGSGILIRDRTYDTNGRQMTESLPYQTVVSAKYLTRSYDNAGRLLSIQSPDSTRKTFDYSGLSETLIDELGNKIVRQLDEVGRLRELQEYSSATTYLSTKYQYGPFDLLATSTNPLSRVSTHSYDLRGRETSLADPNTGTLTHAYSAFDEEKYSKDARGQQVTNTFDLLGRLIKSISSEGTLTQVWDSAANGLGLLASATSEYGVTTTYLYDSLARVSTRGELVDGRTYQFDFAYDTQGRIDTVRYPAVQGARFSVKYGYTPSDYVKSASDGTTGSAFWTTNALNPLGEISKVTYGNLVVSQYTYDPTGLLRFVQSTSSSGDIQRLAYEYYANRNLKARHDLVAKRSEDFTYDALDRLRTWSVGDSCVRSSVNFDYDSAGNLIKRTMTSGSGQTVTYTLTGGTSGGPDALKSSTFGTYTYDAAGDQVFAPGRTTAFDGRGRLKSVSAGLKSATITYGADGRRVLKKYSNGDSVVSLGSYERRVTSGVVSHLFYVNGPQGPVAQVTWADVSNPAATGTTLYLHHDRIGSIDVATDKNGAVVQRFAYEPFGGSRNPSSIVSAALAPKTNLQLGFASQRAEPDFGLLQFGERYYDPNQGRFISPDPVVRHDGGQRANVYAYAFNNPLKWVDLNGRDPTLGGLGITTVVLFEINPLVGVIVGGAIAVGVWVANNLKTVGEWISKGAEAVVHAVEEAVKWTGNFIADVGKALWEGIKAVGNAVWDVVEFIGGLFGIGGGNDEPPPPPPEPKFTDTGGTGKPNPSPSLVNSALGGVGDGVGDIVGGLAHVVAHPVDTFSALGRTVKDTYQREGLRAAINVVNPVVAIADAGFRAHDAWNEGEPREAFRQGTKALVETAGLVTGTRALASGITRGASNLLESSTDLARRLGREGESAAEILKNTERIPSATGTAQYRIPDVLDHGSRVIGDVKNVGRLSYSNQLKDFAAYAQGNGYTFELTVRTTTRLSGPLQNEITAGNIVLKFLPP